MLARKASAAVNRDSVGGWLYRVAYHVALATKGATDRRRARERQGEVPHPEVLSFRNLSTSSGLVALSHSVSIMVGPPLRGHRSGGTS